MASISTGRFPGPAIRFAGSDRQINLPALLHAVEKPRSGMEPENAGLPIRWRHAWRHRARESPPHAWVPMRWQLEIQVFLTGRAV
jgi:hypothetical protein